MASNPTLRIGSRGEWVEYLQQMLAHNGHDPGAVDGSFGRRTSAAVVAFQQEKGLTPDGVVGPRSWAAIASSAEEGGEEDEEGRRGRRLREDDDDESGRPRTRLEADEDEDDERRPRTRLQADEDEDDDDRGSSRDRDDDEDEDEDDEERNRDSDRQENRHVQIRGDLTLDEEGWAVIANIDNRRGEPIPEGDVEYKLKISGDVDEEEEGQLDELPEGGNPEYRFSLPDLEDGEYTVQIILDPVDAARETAEIQITIEDGELKSRKRKSGGRNARVDFEGEPYYEDGKVIVTIRNTSDDTLEAGDVNATMYARSEVDDWDDSMEIELEDDLEPDDTVDLKFKLADDVPEGEVEATVTLDPNRDGPKQRFTFFAEESSGRKGDRDRDEDEDEDDRGGRSRDRDDDEDEDDDRGGSSRDRDDDDEDDERGGRRRGGGGDDDEEGGSRGATGDSALVLDGEPRVDDTTLEYAARNESYDTVEANSIWDQLTVVDADGESVLELTRAHDAELEPGDIYHGEFDVSALTKGEYSARLWLDYGRQGPIEEFTFSVSREGIDIEEGTGDFDFDGSSLEPNGTPSVDSGVITYWCKNNGRRDIDAGTIVDVIYITNDDNSFADSWQQVWEEAVGAGDTYEGSFVLRGERPAGRYTATLYLDYTRSGPTVDVDWEEEGSDDGGWKLGDFSRIGEGADNDDNDHFGIRFDLDDVNFSADLDFNFGND